MNSTNDGGKRKCRLVKHSLNRQASVIFCMIMLITLFLCWLTVTLFLGKFYMAKKKQTLIKCYNQISESIMSGAMGKDSFDIDMSRYASRHNLSIVLVSDAFEPILMHSNEPDSVLLEDISDNISGKAKFKYIIQESNEFVIARKTDMKMKIDYMEMWGDLHGGVFFLLRTPIESIQESTKLSNRFLLYVGIVFISVSSFVILGFSRRFTKPALELANISEKIAHMDFSAKYTSCAGNEIDLLGNNINKLSHNLEKAISELKEANLELKRDNEEKTQIDEMRKEFLSNVSHELKTPIALVQGYAEGLKECVNDEEERDYYCDVIIDETAKMNDIVKKLLALNQLEFGYNNVYVEQFDIMQLINNYISSSDILLKRNDIYIVVSDVSDVMVWSDEFMIEEVFGNLFSNAVNHCVETEVDGSKKKLIRVSVENKKDVVTVSVFNSGLPIPEDSIAYIWDKFYKVDKARTRSYGGSGVGLSIVKAIMETLNQNYGVENCDNGVRFWFNVDAGTII